jgi:hypothetical protein
MKVIDGLKYINRLPLPVTVRHYATFGEAGESLDGEMRSGDDWMVLRNEHPRYRIPEDRETWLKELALDGVKDGQDPALLERVASFVKLLKERNITTVYSVGSGGAIFEYYLKKASPDTKVIVTECTQEGVQRLKRVFTEADGVELFDALDAKEWKHIGEMPSTIVFIYRNEREFTNKQWKQMFVDMHSAGVQHVFVGLMWTLTIVAYGLRVWNNTKRRLSGKKLSFVGYIRSLSALRQFWKGKYTEKEEIYFPTCTGLYLTRAN